ncbi:hypothetical protein ABIF65_000585 [Bradyrhizobium japonicum]
MDDDLRRPNHRPNLHLGSHGRCCHFAFDLVEFCTSGTKCNFRSRYAGNCKLMRFDSSRNFRPSRRQALGTLAGDQMLSALLPREWVECLDSLPGCCGTP